jgi:hypothetical protein
VWGRPLANTNRSSSGGHVFLSYVGEDRQLVDWLQARLERAGIPVWRDVRDLWPGDVWKRRIQDAVEHQSLAYVPCFSSNLKQRARSTMYTELSWAAEEYRRRPPDIPWMIPVLLDDCALPWYDLGAGLTIADLQWANLADGSREHELDRLITVLCRILGSSPGDMRESAS